MDTRLVHLETAAPRRSLQSEKNGYLANHCPPPLEWRQKKYDCYLIRDACLYFTSLDIPDNRIDIDEGMFQLARKKFPYFSQYFLEALYHE